jgi:hypothetical protein
MPSTRRYLSINDQRWSIRVNPRLRKLWGVTVWSDREIQLATHDDAALLDDTIIHELSHALMPWANERFVTAFARAVCVTCRYLPYDENPLHEAVDLLLPSCTTEFAEHAARILIDGRNFAHALNPC